MRKFEIEFSFYLFHFVISNFIDFLKFIFKS